MGIKVFRYFLRKVLEKDPEDSSKMFLNSAGRALSDSARDLAECGTSKFY
jgi:hypothetical protein